MKLACVVQRYGAGVAGGSERHCRELALRLAARHDVTVLTTCAADYVTWANEFPAGESVDGPLRVRRFPVSRPRRLKRFAELSDEVFDGRAPEAQQEDWFRENGPDCPALLDYLRADGAHFDLVLFWTFRYAPSFFGVPLVRDRAVLLPTAEEDRAVDLSILEGFFQMPAAYLFLTPEEETLVSTRAGRPLQPSAVIGMGLDAAPPAVMPAPLRDPYLLYVGRVDRNKGCDTLLEYFTEYTAVHEGPSLVLAGPAKMQVPAHPRVRALGRVSDDERDALLQSRAGARRAVAVREPEHRAARRVESRRAGDRQRAVRRAQGAGTPGQRRLVLPLGRRVCRSRGDAPRVGARAPRVGRTGACLRRARVPLADRDGAG